MWTSEIIVTQHTYLPFIVTTLMIGREVSLFTAVIDRSQTEENEFDQFGVVEFTYTALNSD